VAIVVETGARTCNRSGARVDGLQFDWWVFLAKAVHGHTPSGACSRTTRSTLHPLL